MRRRQRLGDLRRQVERGLEIKRAPGDALPQRAPLEQLHHDERPALVLVDVVDGADVRMVQRRRRAGFAAEALERLAILRRRVRQELEGDETAEPQVFGLVDDAHPALAELRDDAVSRQRAANHVRMAEGYTAHSL